jgi:predicted O-methyltransferase YrrM
MKLVRMIKGQFYKLQLMILSDAPIWLIATHFRLNYLHRFYPENSKMKIEQDLFRKFSEGFQFNDDWFTGNITTWLRAFQEQAYEKNAELNCLEIGSWQGQSALFLLHHFGRAKLTCVDTWEGADEHKLGDAAIIKSLSSLERVFDGNLSRYRNRLTKYKGSSYQYFNENFERDKFDLIYIDGSHHSDDVLVDAIKSFEMLKVNGLMIFDDYFWKYYTRTIDNPSGAINAFIRMKFHQLKVICFDYQLIVRKTTTSVRWSD